jgi:nucleotide-binding universal stress UspA family protein
MKILLAVDASAESQVAVEEAVARPWPAGSSVEVLTVVEPSHLWTLAEVATEVTRRSQEMADRAAGSLRAAGLQSSATVLSGDPRSVIPQHAQDTRADLILVGSHGASAVRRFLLGSVAAAVVRHAHCSVEIVRSAHAGGARKLLLATDGSDFSQHAAQSIASRPWPAGTEVRVLSVVELVVPAAQAMFEPPQLAGTERMQEVRAAAMKRAEDAVRAAEEILTGAGLAVSDSISVLLEGPKSIILDEAEEWEADMIVVGSHGRRGMDRFLLGSISEAVATHAQCSVEVIRKPA